jgi:ABC-type glycerol-3-phosphate transport system substrate-binding protein
MQTISRSKLGALNRREFLQLAGLAGGATLLAACGAPATPAATEAPAVGPTAAPVEEPTEAPTQEPTEAPTAVVAEEEQVQIDWWNPMNSPANKAVMPLIVDDFMAAYPNIRVNYELSGGPPGGGDYVEVLLSRVAGGNPPDCAMIWTPAMQFAVRGALEPIDDLMATARYGGPDKWLEMPLKSCQWQGQTYALVTSAANAAIFLDLAMFEEKGVSISRDSFPKTWDELQELSAQFTVWEGDLLKTVGIVPWGAGGGWARPAWIALNGGRIFDQSTNTYLLDSEENVETLNYWLGWLDAQFRGDIELLNQSGNWAGIWDGTAFLMGTAAMADDGSWALTNYGVLPFPFEVAKNPIGPSGSKDATAWYPSWEVVMKGAKHRTEAFLFNEYFCTVGWVRWYQEGCPEIPAWKDAPKDIYNKVLADAVGVERAKDLEGFFRTYLEESAVEMWNSPVEDYANDVINTAIDEVFHKTKSAAEALAEAQQLCQAKVQEVIGGV